MSEYIRMAAQRAAKANPKEPGDFLGEDGLLYCGKCKTPKQKRLTEYGVIVACTCVCAREKQEREEKRKKLEERFNKACSLPVFAELHDKHTASFTFAEHDGTSPTAMKAAKNFVEHWEEARKRGVGLMFWGNTGTGKTVDSGCIANALMAQKVPVLVTTMPRILSAISGGRRDVNALFDSFQAFDLLVLDDFGAEWGSSFVQAHITRLVDEWAKAKKPLVISTNLTVDNLKSPETMEQKRIYDRIMALCVPVKLDGESHRAQQAKENLAWMRSILNG